MLKKLVNYFLQGLLYIAPFTIVIYIVFGIFSFMDGLLEDVLTALFGMHIPGLGVLTLVVFLIFIGYIGNTIIARPLKRVFRNVVERVPFLKFVYEAFNDLFSAFVGKEKKFNKPVLVVINKESNIEKLGFVTEENLEFLNESDKVAVYFPHSYNFSGELFVVPKSQVKPIDVSSSQMMKFIVSAGLAGMSQESSEPNETPHEADN